MNTGQLLLINMPLSWAQVTTLCPPGPQGPYLGHLETPHFQDPQTYKQLEKSFCLALQDELDHFGQFGPNFGHFWPKSTDFVPDKTCFCKVESLQDQSRKSRIQPEFQFWSLINPIYLFCSQQSPRFYSYRHWLIQKATEFILYQNTLYLMYFASTLWLFA